MTNVLADKHHAGLFRSLQLLADRMGWTLYTPTGHEWFDEWVWSFGRSTYGDDRLARQFLGWTDPDPEFPDVPINYVTLEQAQAMDWAFVIASVPDNEAGFAKFAREHGAEYVLQVGNTGQAIDWSRNPLAIVSSEMPILGRGVRYHQEMEPIEYVPPDPGIFVGRVGDKSYRVGRTVASFVNCMTSMGSCWDLLAQAAETLDVAVYGIDGPQGVLKPFSGLVERMASVGWGWHDKAQGDGFGHVIHSWAAVGRPLIGHASHYAGRMAEHFWQDGITCIDLDRHSIRDAVEIVRTISPEDHERMCRAIRAEFDTIDYAAEAEAIRELLTAVPA